MIPQHTGLVTLSFPSGDAREAKNASNRKLAIIIDQNRPGGRLPVKRRQESELIALEFHVISFTELEILSNPEDCRERVEAVHSHMTDDVLVDAGMIQEWRNETYPPYSIVYGASNALFFILYFL